MVNIGIGTALISAILGYAVVFLGIVFLMAVIFVMGQLMKNKKNKNSDEAIVLPPVSAPAGVDPKKVAAITAVLAEINREA